MKKTIEIECCDLCKEEKKTQTLNIVTYRTFDDTDGMSRYKEPVFTNVKGDFCNECLQKIAVIQDVGVQCVDLQINPLQ